MTTVRFLPHIARAATATKVKLLVVSKLVACLLLAPSSAAQQSALNNPPLVCLEYSQPTSNVELFKLNHFPMWATADMQLRTRSDSELP
jgi:hypothetical protein